MPLKIFITGASSGIGAEIARQYSLLNRDNVIGLIGRNKTKLSKLHKQLGCKSLPIVADVSDFNSIETAAQIFLSEYGLPDIVIANAGVSSGTLLQNKDDIEVIEKMFKINFHGVVNTFHPFVSSFMKQKSGHLVAIASVAGIRGLPGAGAYSASKAALINYMESKISLFMGQSILISLNQILQYPVHISIYYPLYGVVRFSASFIKFYRNQSSKYCAP